MAINNSINYNTTQYNVLTGGANNLLNNVAPSSTSGVPLISQGASSQPIFGTAVVQGGGTGATTLTGVLIGNGTSAITGNAVTQHSVLVGGASNAITSIANGTTGQVLTANTGADPSWTSLGTGVSSVTGTANQIVASPTTGAVVLSFDAGLSIGSYQATTPPTGGIIAPGQLGIGTTSPTGVLEVFAIGSSANTSTSSTNALQLSTGHTTSTDYTLYMGADRTNHVGYIQASQYNSSAATLFLQARGGQIVIGNLTPVTTTTVTIESAASNILTLGGTQTALASNTQFGIILDSEMNPTGGASVGCFGIYADIEFVAPSTTTIAAASAVYVNNLMNANAGTITNAYGIFVDTGTSGAATITNSYGGYFATPAYGSTALALYATNSQMNSLVMTGLLTGTSTAPPRAISITNNFEVTSGSAIAAGLYISPQTTASSGTMTNMMGIFVTSGNPTTPATTTAYGLYVQTPTYATTHYCAYLQANVGINQIAPINTLETTNSGAFNNAESAPTNGFMTSTGHTSSDWALYMGADSNNSLSYIQSANYGVAVSTLCLNARGGSVTIGTQTISNSSALTVSGTGAYNTVITGTQTANSSNFQYGFSLLSTFNPTSNLSGDARAVTSQGTFIAPTATTMANATGIYISNTVSGNIGTISTLYGLHVDTGSSSGGTITTSYGAYIAQQTAGSTKIALYADNVSVGFASNAPPSSGMIVSGNVFIGSASQGTIAGALYVGSTASTSFSNYGALSNNASTPASHVAGSSGTVGVAISANGRIVSNSEIDATSDRRKKENIADITTERAMQFVKGVTPVSFNRKDSGEFSHGYIAQDVVKNFGAMYTIFPTTDELPETIDEDGFVSPSNHIFTLSYDQAIPLLHKVIKDLLKRVEYLEDLLDK